MAKNTREVADQGKKMTEANVLPKARRMKALGVNSDKKVALIETISKVPRAVDF